VPTRILASEPTSQQLDEFLTQGVVALLSTARKRPSTSHSTNSGPVAIVQAPDFAQIVHQINQWLIGKLRKLRSVESGINAAVATGHDPLVHDEPELARTLAASVQPRIAS
jgi:hypothetical protein